MKTLKSLIILMLISVSVFAEDFNSDIHFNNDGEKITVYYFHNTRRCPTCLAIEKETKMVLEEESFAQAIEKGFLEFKSFNAEKKSNRKLIKEFGITGSALIIVKGKKKTDLTSKGFMYALKQPEKLRQAVRDALNN